MYLFTASIVTYNNKPELINQAIESFLNTSLPVQLYISDNSETSELKESLLKDSRIQYEHNGANLGFGKAHNNIIDKVSELSKYHIILNPDIYYTNPNTLASIDNCFKEDSSVGAIMPKVVYPNGETQWVAKLLPTPVDLIARRFLPFLANKQFDLSFTGYSTKMNIPFISGCFMAVRTSILKEIGGFDDRYFMYCEDIDLSRRIHKSHQTILLPTVEVIHHHAQESYKSKKLLKIHIKSAIKYFNKWGWLWDSERRKFNKATLQSIAKNNKN